MNKITPTILAAYITIILIFYPCTLQAEPTFSAAECPEPGSSGWNLNPGEPIAIYIEDDFGEELAGCTTGEAQDLTNLQARNIILAAAEIWNREARAAVFYYAGTKTYEAVDTSTRCNSFANKPAVYVRLDITCVEVGCGTSTAKVLSITECTNPNVIELAVSGGHSAINCTNSPLSWNVSGEINDRDLFHGLVHELGHVLDLNHPEEAVGGDPTNSHSVVEADAAFRPWHRHLYPWDYDCVDDAEIDNTRGVRELRYTWKGIGSSGTWQSGVSQGSQTNITKGFLGGGHIHNDNLNSTPYYAFYDPDNEIWSGIAGTSTTPGLAFSQQSDFRTAAENLYISPTLMRAHEMSGSNEAHRLNFARYPTSGPLTYSTWDPPPWRHIRSEDWFDTDTYNDTRFQDGGSTSIVQTHIPLISAWDEHSDTTVFVRVNTERSLTDHGEINLHPGFNSGSTTTLRAGSVLSDNQSAPTALDPNFDYTLKTESAPGIACAPNRSTYSYNCILAWLDRGHPDARVLYTYFRVKSSTYAIEWITGSPNTWVRSGAVAVGNISAAFFHGNFWLAWKSKDTGPDVEWTQTQGSPTIWTAVASLGRSRVADSPTWLYTPTTINYEAGLIWTEF